jgi:hypothetical protein
MKITPTPPSPVEGEGYRKGAFSYKGTATKLIEQLADFLSIILPNISRRTIHPAPKYKKGETSVSAGYQGWIGSVVLAGSFSGGQKITNGPWLHECWGYPKVGCWTATAVRNVLGRIGKIEIYG